LFLLVLFQRRYDKGKLAETKLVVRQNTLSGEKDLHQKAIDFPFEAKPSMMIVARITEMLASTYFAHETMPLLKNIIFRDGMEEKELHISEMIYNNILRLGTTYTDGSTQMMVQEESTAVEPIPIEKVFINIVKNNDVFASDKGGAETDFQPVTASDWTDNLTKPRAKLKVTSDATPAGISLFVAMGCKDEGNSRKKGHTTVLTPCYIVQPEVNVRDLSSGVRLDDQTGQIATAMGRTPFDLSTHEMQGCLYSVVAVNRYEHARLLPMVSTGFQPGTGRETLCGSPGAMPARVHDVDILWYALFGLERVDCVEVTKCGLNDVERATVIFNSLIGRLTKEYDGLRNVSEWMRLHRRLREFMWEGIAMKYRPTNENELYHEVRVMIQALTPLRIAMLDGLGRIGGTVYALLGRKPERNAAEVTVRLCDLSRIIPFTPEIYSKTGATTKLGLVCVDNNSTEGSEPWTKEVVEELKEYSARLQENFLVVTQRSVQDCLYDIVKELGSVHMEGNDKHQPHYYLTPGEFGGKKSDDLNTVWLGGIRLDVLGLIQKDKSPFVKDLLLQLEKQAVYASNPKQWEADNLGVKQGSILDTKDVRYPKKIMTMVMLLTQFQFANRKNADDLKSLIELQKFIRWNGKGVYNAGKEDDRPLGLPPHELSNKMMGFFPTSTDRNMHDFDDNFTWLLQRPQMLLGYAMAKKLLRDGKFQGANLANLGPRYIMTAGSSLLCVYNQSGPILDMSEALQEVMPKMYELLKTNPFDDQSTWDNVPKQNLPHFYSLIEPSGESTKLWSNIPQFVCLLTFIAMRSDLVDLPETEKPFRFHQIPKKAVFDLNGNLLVDAEDMPVVAGWAQDFSPKFAFEVQESQGTKEVNKVVGATLLEMVDLLLNEKSELWPKFFVKDPVTMDVFPSTKRELRNEIDALCGLFDWKDHYFDALGEFKTYTQLTNKTKPPRKLDKNVLLGYVEVKSSDETGKEVIARMSRRAHRQELAEQKKKRKHETREETRSSNPMKGTSSQGGENQSDKRRKKGDDVESEDEDKTEFSDKDDVGITAGSGGGGIVDHADTDTDTNTDTNTNTNTNANANTDTDTNANTNANPDPDSVTDSAAAELNTGKISAVSGERAQTTTKRRSTDPDSDTDTDPDTDTNTNANTDTAADADNGTETEEEATDALRYSSNYLKGRDKSYTERELEDTRADPSTMYRDIGREYLQRAGRCYLNCELSGMMMAAKREEHKGFWQGVSPADINTEEEQCWREDFAKDKKELAEMMWKQGDMQLADNKELEASLMSKDFVEGIERVIQNYVAGYATWIERQVMDKEQTGNEAQIGTVSYLKRCIQITGTAEPEDKSELDEAIKVMKEMPNRRNVSWKQEQFTSLTNATVAGLQDDYDDETPRKSQQELSEKSPSPRGNPKTTGLDDSNSSTKRNAEKTVVPEPPNTHTQGSQGSKSGSKSKKNRSTKKATPVQQGSKKKAKPVQGGFRF
jgi:hypothetical protein